MTTRSPADAEALKSIAAAREKGEDPFGDDEFDVPDVNASASAEDAAEAERLLKEQTDADASADAAAKDYADQLDADATKKVDGDELDADALAAIAGDDEPQAQPQPVAPQYQAKVPEDYATQRKTLLTEKATAMKQLMEGEIDPDAFAEIDMRVSNQLEELTTQRIRAETLIEANTQAQFSQQQNEIKRLIAAAKPDLDYTANPVAQKQFDLALDMLRTDPANASKPYGTLVDEAHKAVMALRGKPVATRDAPLTKEEIAAKLEARKDKSTLPITLRNTPQASAQSAGGDALEALGRLKGAAYQAAFAKLPARLKASLLDE